MEKLREAGALREENENLEDTHGFEVVGTDHSWARPTGDECRVRPLYRLR
jgi:hypothetical protein